MLTLKRMTKKRAAEIVGGLSNPSKMPGHSIGLPARKSCPIGDKLALIVGTPCHDCYADERGMYIFPVVKAAQARRFAAVQRALVDPDFRALWIDAMVRLLDGEPWFRWHDSGDVFHPGYLAMIIEVVRRTPATRHWLPTQERATVRAWMREHGPLPENLTVRISMPKVDASAENAAATQRALGLPTSSVTTGVPTCPAPFQDNECKECRNCWDRDVAHVTYAQH
jgi:hypothetical protein